MREDEMLQFSWKTEEAGERHRDFDQNGFLTSDEGVLRCLSAGFKLKAPQPRKQGA